MDRLLILLCLVLPARSRPINPFVVGGSNTHIVAHPHQLSLRVSGSHSCGASLISTTRAVCAAHCGGSAITVYTVLGGTSDRTDSTCDTCITRNPTSFIKHPNFVNSGVSGYPNDVGVIFFAAVTTNDNLQTIPMATEADGDFSGQTCIITGWGMTSSESGLPLILQQGAMSVMSNEACANSWGSTRINAGHICVIAPSVSACNGDSGGPLVCESKLTGVTSWGSSSCSPTSPSVYTRISYFYDWIISLEEAPR